MNNLEYETAFLLGQSLELVDKVLEENDLTEDLEKKLKEYRKNVCLVYEKMKAPKLEIKNGVHIVDEGEFYKNCPSSSYHGQYISMTFGECAMIFGVKSVSDDYKTAEERFFVVNGVYCSLYDWKETSLYDKELPHLKTLKSEGKIIDFHIGSKEPLSDENLNEVKRFVGERLNRYGS